MNEHAPRRGRHEEKLVNVGRTNMEAAAAAAVGDYWERHRQTKISSRLHE